MVINNILNEIIQTEHSYQQDLELINNIREDLLNIADIDVDTLDKSQLLKALELIQKISDKQAHIALHFDSLKSHFHIEENNSVSIIDQDAFNSTINSLKTALTQAAKDYANYFIIFENFTKNIAPKLNKAKLQEAIEAAGGHSRLLNSFLITPIQRFPRYEMLFKELSKHLPFDHPAKQSLEDLFHFTRRTCAEINNVVQFYDNVKQGYTGINLHNDSRFRRQVKGYLNDLMAGNNQEAHLSDALHESGLTITTKGKRFSNKRSYNFTNSTGQMIFNIVVNRNSLSFRFTEHFDSLAVDEKIALFRLQYFLTMAIENSFQANAVDLTKRHLEILGEVDYYNTPATHLALALEDEDEEDEEIEEVEAAVDFRTQLNTLFMHHKGLTRQGSLLKENHDNLKHATYGEHAKPWKLVGLARK